MSEVCDICAETFTAKSRKKIPCPYDCGLTCCIACIKRQYNENEDDIQCMGCRKSYTQSQLTEMFSQTYIKKEYKQRRGEILFNREKAQIPATMPFVEQLVEADHIFEQVRKLRTENERMRKVMEENNENIYQMMDRINVLREGKVSNSSGGGFTVPCCKGDCHGFVDTSYTCKVCTTKMCKDCHCEKTEGHECDPQTVETIKEIKKTCKNCPKCGTSIHKIEGCDQMWCTKCHTTFSWRSGQPVTGVVHNPHYFAYMRENGGIQRQPGDIPCGGLPGAYELRSYNPLISEFTRMITHVDAVEIPHYTVQNDNKKLRASFIRKEINKESFVAKLLANERDEQKAGDIRNVLEMFKTVGTDLVQKTHQDIKDLKKDPTAKKDKNRLQEDLIKQFIELIDYTNNEFRKVTHAYKLVAPFITVDQETYINRNDKTYWRLGVSSTRQMNHQHPYALKMYTFVK